MNAAQHVLGTLKPPAGYQATYDLLVKAVDALVEAGRYYPYSALLMDSDALQHGNDSMAEAEALFEQMGAARPVQATPTT